MLKKIHITFIVILGIVCMALVAAMFYFGQIAYNTGFNIHAKFNPGGQFDNAFMVEKISANSITLRYDYIGFTPLMLPGKYTLIAENGRGDIGAIITKNKTTVTRSFKRTEGQIQQGDHAILSNNLRTNDQDLKNLKESVGYQTVYYENKLGKFRALLTNNESPNWVICVHGLRGDALRYSCIRDSRVLIDQGARIFSISYRNDKGNPQDPSQMYLYGATEWKDLAAAIDYAERHGAKKIILYGISMGGAVALSYVRHATINPNIKGVVLNAPVINFYQSIKTFGQAAYPFLPDWFLLMTKHLMSAYYGINWDAVNQENALANRSIPILLIHGTEDNYVPISQADQLYRRHPMQIIYYRSQGVHGGVYNVDTKKYNDTLIHFLNTNFNRQE